MHCSLKVAGFVVGMVIFIPGTLAMCLPINPVTNQPCISYQGYSAGKSYQGNRHKHYFTNTCRKRLQITYEWVDAVPRKWNHKVLKRGRKSISCLQGACPGPVVWAPVCRDGSVGASNLARLTSTKNTRHAAQPARQRPSSRTSQDQRIIGTWDYKNTHDCPRHTMGCNGRYDFVAKKSMNSYLFRGVISCRRAVKRGVKVKLKSEKTFTTYFDETWTVKNGKLTATSKVKSKDKNISAITLTSTLHKNTFSGSGLSCGGQGRQSWTATKRSP